MKNRFKEGGVVPNGNVPMINGVWVTHENYILILGDMIALAKNGIYLETYYKAIPATKIRVPTEEEQSIFKKEYLGSFESEECFKAGYQTGALAYGAGDLEEEIEEEWIKYKNTEDETL